MAKVGRPTKTIDREQFEKLCALQCTKEEISDWFDVSEDTIERWCRKTYNTNFAVVFGKKRNLGKISLRRAGFKLAEKNAAVHIFYAKNFLGMTDKTEQVITNIEDLTPLADMLKYENTDD